MLDALELGYAVSVITDGCRGVNVHPQDSAHAFMEWRRQARRCIRWPDWEEAQGGLSPEIVSRYRIGQYITQR